jgi:photosystem II stability/assembly factor-like uncharacterized protein
MKPRLSVSVVGAILLVAIAFMFSFAPVSAAVRGRSLEGPSGVEKRQIDGAAAGEARGAAPVSRQVAVSGGWTVQPSGTSALMEGVSFTDALNGFAVGHEATILRTKNGGSTWQALSSPFPADAWLTDVEFTTSLDGWVIGLDNASLHTTDGGTTWKLQELLLLYPLEFYELSSVDTQHTWIGAANTKGYSILQAQFWKGLVIGTDNGGPTWWASPQLLAEQLDAGTAFFGIDFVDLSHGWAISFNGGLFKTTDGGRNWVDVSPEGNMYGADVSFCDAGNGWAVGSAGGQVRVFHTTNGGQSWTTQATELGLDPSNDELSGVWAVDPSTCWAVGNGGVVIHTTNGGQTWSVERPVSANLYDLCFVDGETGWVVGEDGVILRHGGSTPTLSIASLTPSHGPVGSSVTIAGSNLGASGTVKFGSATAGTSSWSAGSITCTVPGGLSPGSVSVTVTSGGTTSNALSFTVEQAPASDPVLTALIPNHGVAGATVILTGTDLGTSGTVKFGATSAATSSWAATAIVATVPGGLSPGSVSVTVTSGGQTSNALSFTVEGGGGGDVTPPVTTASGYDDAWHSSPVTVTFAALDPGAGASGVAYTEYRLDGGGWTRAARCTVPAPADTKLTHTIGYRSADNAGNLEAEKSCAVKIDTTGSLDTVGPVCEAKNASVRRGKSCKILFKVNDALSAEVTTELVITTKSGVVKKRWSWDYEKPPVAWWYVTYKCTLAKGSYRIVVSGKDLAGNAASVIGRATLTVK